MNNENQDHLENIAAYVLSAQGVDFATAQRAGGWTNAVWIADELVLRLSTQKEDDKLLREAKLSGFFPSQVGYPKTINSGTTAGYAWVLSEKLPGCRLGEAWAKLDGEGRVTALQALWQRAEAVHSVPCGAIATKVPREAWFNATDPEEAEASLSRLTRQGIFSKTESTILQGCLARFWEALPNAPCVLCHGDLTMDNAMWSEGRVIALLDFEFAVLAPIQLDLNHLVKIAFGPDGTTMDNNEAQRLWRAVEKLARPVLEQPNSEALLTGYAILLELYLLESWLAHPEGEGPLECWEPLRRLRSLADGKGGYLALLLSSRR